MPQELPAVACSLLKESGEIPLLELAQAAKEVSSKALGSRWSSREDCPCTMPAGANLQAAYPELRHIQLDTPEGLIAGLGYALTRPGHTFQFLSVSRVCPWAGRACTAYTSGSSVPPAPGCPRPLPPSRRPARCYRAKTDTRSSQSTLQNYGFLTLSYIWGPTSTDMDRHWQTLCVRGGLDAGLIYLCRGRHGPTRVKKHL